jgi:WD40 repeat protein
MNTQGKEDSNLLKNVTLYECGNSHSRNFSRSVSWNSVGTTLAAASSQSVKLWPCPGNSATNYIVRENGILEHRSLVDRVRFHPSDPNLLCTSSYDKSVQLWDIRSNTNRPFGIIDLKSDIGNCAQSIEWFGGHKYSYSNGGGAQSDDPQSKYLVVSEKDNSVHIYDIRKLQQSKHRNHRADPRSSSQSGSDSSAGQIPIQSFHLAPHSVRETHVSPSGTHLISAGKNGNDGLGSFIIYPWKKDKVHDSTNVAKMTAARSLVGHTGPILTFKFSPNGKLMATGGSDALVGLWDVQSTVCTSTITRRSRFIRCVSYSYDSKLVACCSEENGVDVSNAITGELIGNVNLSKQNNGNKNNQNSMRFPSGACDEIAFHPKSYLLACARGSDEGNVQVPLVTIAKIQDIVNR